MFSIDGEITDYRSTLGDDRQKHARFVRLVRERGISRGPGKLYLSIAHDQREIDETLRALASAVDASRR